MLPHWNEPFQFPTFFNILDLLLLSPFNTSSIYDSGALTPDTYAEPSSTRHRLLTNEGAPQTQMQTALYTYFIPKPK